MTYRFTLYTPSNKLCRYAGQERTLEFTGTREELFNHIRYKCRTYERLSEIKIKQGNEWVREGLT